MCSQIVGAMTDISVLPSAGINKFGPTAGSSSVVGCCLIVLRSRDRDGNVDPSQWLLSPCLKLPVVMTAERCPPPQQPALTNRTAVLHYYF